MLSVRCDPELGFMHARRSTQGSSIYYNLLGDSAEFAEKGTISLAVTRKRVDRMSWLTFEVSDSGIGMTPERFAICFKPFRRPTPPPRADMGEPALAWLFPNDCR